MPWWLAGMPPKTDKSKRQVCRSALHLHFAACECQVYANGTTSVTKHNVSRHVVEGKNLVQCCCPTKWLTGSGTTVNSGLLAAASITILREWIGDGDGKVGVRLQMQYFAKKVIVVADWRRVLQTNISKHDVIFRLITTASCQRM